MSADQSQRLSGSFLARLSVFQFMSVAERAGIEGVVIAIPGDYFPQFAKRRSRTRIGMLLFLQSAASMLALLSAYATAQAVADQDLVAAIEAGNVQEVGRLLAAGADVNSSVADSGGTPLLKAMERLTHPPSIEQRLRSDTIDSVAIVELLLTNGADVKAGDHTGITPLHYAVAAGHEDLLTRFIEKGAVINARNNEGVSPLYIAVNVGRADLAALLIARGAEVNTRTRSDYTPLTVAASRGDLSVVKLLVEHNADVNVIDREGKSPLLWTLKGLQGKWIINSSSPGAVDERKEMGDAALQEFREVLNSVPGHWIAVAKLLIEHGADVNIALEDDTPIAIAALVGDKALIGTLLEKGANINGVKHAYETPLHAAIAERHRDMVEFLVKNGADVNAPNRSGRTPLHFVAHYMDDPELVKVMINRGANVNARDMNGATPLRFAINARNNKTAKVIQSHGGK